MIPSKARWTWDPAPAGGLKAGSGRAWSPIVDGRLNLDVLREPLRARNAGKILVCPNVDLFEGQPFDSIAAVFGVMILCQEQTFLVVTKYPERAVAFFAWLDDQRTYGGTLSDPAWTCQMRAIDLIAPETTDFQPSWPPPNVWFGVEASTQRDVEERVPLLGRVTLARHFLVLDPLLEGVALTFGVADPHPVSTPEDQMPAIALLDRIVVGGDHQRAKRPFRLAWLRSLIKQADTANVALFVERLGATPEEDSAYLDRDSSPWPPDTTLYNDMPAAEVHRVKLRSAYGSDINEWPSDVRRRDQPEP